MWWRLLCRCAASGAWPQRASIYCEGIPTTEAEQPRFFYGGQEWPTKLLLLLIYSKTACALAFRRCVLAPRNAMALSATIRRACTFLQHFYNTVQRQEITAVAASPTFLVFTFLVKIFPFLCGVDRCRPVLYFIGASDETLDYYCMRPKFVASTQQSSFLVCWLCHVCRLHPCTMVHRPAVIHPFVYPRENRKTLIMPAEHAVD